MTRLEKAPGKRSLYRDPVSLLYYVRSQKGSVNSYTSLNTTRKEQAIQNPEDLKGQAFRRRHDIPDEKKAKPSPLIGIVLDRYREAKYPDGKQRERDLESSYYRNQESYYTTLKQFFAQKYVSELRPALLNEYHRWRKSPERLRKAAKGDRITDLELTCLSNALTWAAGQDLITVNPIKNRTRYQSGKDIRHCKEFAPEDMNDLHSILKTFFSDPRSEALGFQASFEALSGARTSEALAMRLDGKPGEPGALSSDRGSLYVRHARKSQFENDLVYLHEGLMEWREAFLKWHEERFPNSPWYFPNLRHGGQSTLEMRTDEQAPNIVSERKARPQILEPRNASLVCPYPSFARRKRCPDCPRIEPAWGRGDFSQVLRSRASFVARWSCSKPFLDPID